MIKCQHYRSTDFSECLSCRASAAQPPNRRVSSSSLNRCFNDVVTVVHIFMGHGTLLHMMDVVTQFSAAYVGASTALGEAIIAFESCWLASFWPLSSIQGDKAFNKIHFTKFVQHIIGATFCPVPPRRNRRNPIESGHGVICSTFLQLQHANPEIFNEVHALCAASISNALYGSDIRSTVEAGKGFSRPCMAGLKLIPVTEELITAEQELAARQKLAMIMCVKSIKPSNVQVSDVRQIHVRHSNQKWSKCFLLVKC